MAIVNKRGVIIFRTVLYVTAMLLILFVGAFLSLQTRPVRDALTRVIEKTIAQKTGSVCRIEDLSSNLISRFEISGIEFTDIETGALLMKADRIGASYSIPMLLARVLRINRLTIDGAFFDLIQKKDGAWNFESFAHENASEPLPAQSPKSKASLGFKVEIRHLIVKDADITLSQQTDSDITIRHLGGINAQVGLHIGDEIYAKIKHLTVRLDDPHVNVRDLSGDLQYNFAKRCVDFNNTRIKGEKSDFMVNGRLIFPDQGPDWVSMDLQADIAKLSLGEFGRAFPIQMPDEDVVFGNISVRGPVSKMDCQVDLSMDSCRVLSQGWVTIDEANAVGIDISGNIKGLDLSRLPALDLKFLPGDLNTDYTLFWQRIGRPDQTGRIQLDLQPSRLKGYFMKRAKLDLQISGPDFIVNHLDLKMAEGDFTGSGLLAGFMSSAIDNRIQFTTDFKGINPEKFIKDPRCGGRLNGFVRSTLFIPKTFDIEETTGKVTCRIGSSMLMGMEVRSAELEAALANEEISVSRLSVESCVGSADVTGKASITDHVCRFNAKANLLDLKLIKPFIPALADIKTFSDNVYVSADITGKWEAPDIAAVLNGEKIVFNDVSADSFSANGKWQGGLKHFNISATCKMKNCQLVGLQIPGVVLKTAITPASVQTDIDLRGERNARLRLTGNIDHWLEPVKEISVTKVLLESNDQEPLVNRKPFKLSISGKEINIEPVYLGSGKAFFEFQGHAGLTPTANVKAVLKFRDFDLKRINGFLKKSGEIKGQLAGDVRLDGSLENPVIEGNLSVKEGALGNYAVSKASGTLAYSGSKGIINVSAYSRDEKFLEIKGAALAHLSLYPFSFTSLPEGLDLAVNINKLDVSWISDLMDHPEYAVSGFLDIHASVTGDLLNPHPKGRLMLNKGALKLKQQNLTYESLIADLYFEDNTIAVDRLDIRGDKEGHLEVSGTLNIDQLKLTQFNIQATGDKFYVPFHSGVDARISPDITLSGSLATPRLEGKITVAKGRAKLEHFLEKQVSEIDIVAPVTKGNGVIEIPEKDPESLAFIDPLTADIALVVPGDFWIKGNDEFIEIKGNVRLIKVPHKPFVFLGPLNAVRGTYRFRGKLFQITKGELTFVGQEDINPLLDIEAETRIKDVTIIIRLTGTFQQLNLVLDSEPVMGQADIISYLIFGRAPDDLSEQESFKAEEAALSYSGQIAADKLRDIIGESLGIDYLSISAGSGGLRQGSLTMGKYVLPKVFVVFRQGFSADQVQEVEVTYEINKNFDLETQMNNEQTSAVDLIWKYEF